MRNKYHNESSSRADQFGILYTQSSGIFSFLKHPHHPRICKSRNSIRRIEFRIVNNKMTLAEEKLVRILYTQRGSLFYARFDGIFDRHDKVYTGRPRHNREQQYYSFSCSVYTRVPKTLRDSP